MIRPACLIDETTLAVVFRESLLIKLLDGIVKVAVHPLPLIELLASPRFHAFGLMMTQTFAAVCRSLQTCADHCRYLQTNQVTTAKLTSAAALPRSS